MNLRKTLVIVVPAAIIAGSLLLFDVFTGLKQDVSKAKPEQSKKYVRTEKVKPNTVNTQIVAYGRVQSAQLLDVIAEKQGKISTGNIRLKEGENFRKGTLLFKVDDEEARLNLLSKKSNFMRDLASVLPDMKIDFAENYKAWESYFNSIELEKPLASLPKVVSSKEKTFLATRNIYSNYFAIKSAETALQKHSVYAPFTGSITEVYMQNGSFVNPGSRVAKIVRTDNLELKVPVENHDIDLIKKGQKVMISSEDGQKNWEGHISRISEVVNSRTQSIDVFIAIKENENRIYDGLYLKAQIPGKMIENAIEIPRELIYNGNEVYVIEDSVLKVKKIKVEKLNDETIVFTGLEENTDLVTEQLIQAHDNMKAFRLTDKPLETPNTAKETTEEETEKQS